MGIGSSSGDNRAVEAAKLAIASPLLELSVDGAKGILFTVTGSSDLAMYEVAEAAKVITGSADDDAKVIFGAHVDESMEDEVRVTVVATGFDNRERRSAPALAGDVEVSAQGSWTPTKRIEEEEEHGTQKRSPFEKRRVSASSEKNPFAENSSNIQKRQPSKTQAQSEEENDEDDLGIPAFIRRKMM